MNPTLILIAVLICCTVAFQIGRKRAFSVAAGRARELHSLPVHYGVLTALWCGLPALLVFLVWLIAEPTFITSVVMSSAPAEMKELSDLQKSVLLHDVRSLATGGIVSGEVTPALQEAANQYKKLLTISKMSLFGVMVALGLGLGSLAACRISPGLRARNHVELVVRLGLILCSTLAIFTTVGIVLSVLFEAIRFFKVIPFTDFIFGLKWSPQMAIRADQVGSSGAFGAIPVFWGTLMISGIAMLVAVPLGLMSAVYLSEYASKRVRAVAKPMLEVLAGIPTVVYGFFAALTVAPFLRDMGLSLGLTVSSESALAAGLVMGIMIIPFVSSLSDDVINAVPQAMRDGALALGSTNAETVIRVVLPAALPGIVGSVLFAMSRAIGETMIVVMAAGLSARMTANPLDTVTTVTVQIVTLLVGDQEFDSPKTLAAFALGLLLFVVTLCLNIIALQVVRRYREQYE